MPNRIGTWLRALTRGADRRERELVDEMRFHLDMETEDLVRQGYAPDEARRAARRAFGGGLAAQEAARATAPLHRLEALVQDVRLAPRLLWRSPLLSAAIVITLALGIGVAAGVFTLVDGMLFRPRVSYDPDGFVQLAATRRDSLTHATMTGALALDEFHAYRAARSLRALAAWSPAHLTLGRVDPTETLGLLVSCEFFAVYGRERPLLGRLFTRDECETPGRGAVAVLGEELWRERFAADPAVVGRTVVVNGAPFTVVGVMPARYAGRLRGPGLWVPYSAQPLFFGGNDYFRDDAPAWLQVVGRVAPGWTRTAAAAELRVIAARLDAAHRATHGGRATTLRLTRGAVVDEAGGGGGVAWLVPVVLVAVTLPLVLVCANVTMLLLARAAARRREIAVRLALGAGLGRLLRMMLAESVTLALVAGAASVGLLYTVPALLRHLLFTSDTPFYDTAPHAAALIYLGVVTLGAGLLAGWVPAAESLKQRLTAALKNDDATRSAARGRWGTRDVLVAVQVAVSALLVVGAVLFLRAERGIVDADRGYDTRHTLLLPLGARPAAARVAAEVRALPAVRAVALASDFGGGDEGADAVQVAAPGTGATRRTSRTAVSPELFATVGIRLVRGRPFGGTAAAPERLTEAVVSESLAQALWPNADPIGAVLDDGGRRLEVVGVARDTRPLGGGDADGAQLYVVRDPASAGGVLVARVDGDGAAAARAIDEVVRRLDPDAVPVARTLASIVETQAELFGHVASLVVALGALAVTLAAVGIYGVVAFVVNERTRETGVRLALGATRARVVGAVMGACGRPVAVGLAAGLVLAAGGAAAVERGFRGTPARVDPTDPASYAAAAVLVAAVALAAMGGPALRAARADPVRALRGD